MAIIFCEEGLKDVDPPCVAQTFINHNAVLHKVFVIGNQIYTHKRPSIKNFSAGSKFQVMQHMYMYLFQHWKIYSVTPPKNCLMHVLVIIVYNFETIAYMFYLTTTDIWISQRRKIWKCWTNFLIFFIEVLFNKTTYWYSDETPPFHFNCCVCTNNSKCVLLVLTNAQ